MTMQQSILCRPSLIFARHNEDLVSDLVGYVASSSPGPGTGSEMVLYDDSSPRATVFLRMAVHGPGIFCLCCVCFPLMKLPPTAPPATFHLRFFITRLKVILVLQA